MGKNSFYRCPKCDGSETYTAPRLAVNSQGQQEMKDTKICKACGEVSKFHYVSDDAGKSFWQKYRINFIWYGLIALGLLYIDYKNGQQTKPTFLP
jgi:hypothetical protein